MAFSLNPAKVRDRRKKRCWTQEHLAAVASLSVKTVQRMEMGYAVSAETVMAVATALDASPTSLAGDEPQTFVVAFANEASGTGKSFYALNQAVMALRHRASPLILALDTPFGSAFDADTQAFCAANDLPYQRTSLDRLAVVLHRHAGDAVFIDTPSRLAGEAQDWEPLYRGVARHADLVVIPVTMGAREERAAILTAQLLQPHTRNAVFLMYEHYAVPLSWATLFAAHARLMGMETLDWWPRFTSEKAAVLRSYLPVLSGSAGGGFDEAALGAFGGLWREIVNRVERPRPPMPPSGELLLVPSQLGGLSGLAKR